MATYFWEHSDTLNSKSLLSKIQEIDLETEKNFLGLLTREDILLKELEKIHDYAYDDMHSNHPWKTQEEWMKEFYAIEKEIEDIRKEYDKYSGIFW